MRGTPNHKQGRGAVPFQGGTSPGGSNIPRPVLDDKPSEVGSSVSASRQKQSKRDEVGYEIHFSHVHVDGCMNMTSSFHYAGYP